MNFFCLKKRLRPILRFLLPVWNRGHQFGWRVGEYVDAVTHARFGVCDVCGRFSPWLYRRRVVTASLQRLWGLSERVACALARKESYDCVHCGAKLRTRRLSRVLLDLCTDNPCRSIADWVGRPQSRGLRVALINKVDGLDRWLNRLPLARLSDYTDGTQPGEIVNGVVSEDLTRLTYPDDSFDLVITSETLEHVPDLTAAISEIRRVLVPGGIHVFTIPLLPDIAATHPRRTPIAHPGGDWGYPVFTEFGADFAEIVRSSGFDVEIRFGPVTEDDLAQVYVTCKRG